MKKKIDDDHENVFINVGHEKWKVDDDHEKW